MEHLITIAPTADHRNPLPGEFCPFGTYGEIEAALTAAKLVNNAGGWLVRFIKHRISDRRVIRLIQKWLRAGVLEDRVVTVSETGTGQGSVIYRYLPTSICTTSLTYGPSAGDDVRPRAT